MYRMLKALVQFKSVYIMQINVCKLLSVAKDIEIEKIFPTLTKLVIYQGEKLSNYNERKKMTARGKCFTKLAGLGPAV